MCDPAPIYVRMLLRSTTILCCFLLTCFAVQAQVTARITTDSLQVETGNPFVLHFSVASTKTPDTLNFTPWESFFQPKNLLSQSPWMRQGNNLVCDLTIIFFDADTLSVPPLALTFQSADTAFTNPLEVVVYPTPSADDLNDMAPIKDISREQVLWSDYLPLAVMILVGLGILALMFWWYNRSKKSVARSRAIALPAHELALKKLRVLQEKALWRQGAVKEHCAELTFILREYLEKRFEVPALGSTSEGTLQALKQTDFPAALKPDLENILSQADLAKFAKAIPADDFYAYSLDFAQILVTQTIPPPETAEVETPHPTH